MSIEMRLRCEAKPDLSLQFAEVFAHTVKDSIEVLAHPVLPRGALLVVPYDNDPRRHPKQEEMLKTDLASLVDDDDVEGVLIRGDVLQ